MCRDTTGRLARSHCACLNVTTLAVFLAVASLSKPAESLFEIIKDLHPHTAIDCNSFPKSPGIKHWFLKNVSELRFPGDTMFSYVFRNCITYEFTVKKALENVRFARYFASINEDSFDFVAF